MNLTQEKTNKAKGRPLIVKQADDHEIPFEVMAGAIEHISKSMRAIEKSRATRKLIVALIADNSKLGKGTIEIVLNNLEQLEERYLKKRVPR